MSDGNVVLESINTEDELRCVDIFRRPDGTYGFEEYRRDPEDNRGWFPVGGFFDQVFDQEQAALTEARSKIFWLDALLKS